MIKPTRSKPGRGIKSGGFVLMTGFPKTVKTTHASTYSPIGSPGVLLIDCENGSGDLPPNTDILHVNSALQPVRHIVVNGVETDEWEVVPPIERGYYDNDGNPAEAWSMAEVIDWLFTNWNNLPYTTVVIDTIDALNRWHNDIALTEIKAEDATAREPKYQDAQDVSDIDFGKGYARSRRKTMDKIYRLCDLLASRKDGLLICICHMKQTIMVNDGKTVIPQRLPQLPQELARELANNAELICLTSMDTAGNAIVSFDGYGETFIGSRLSYLQGKTFKVPKNMTLYQVIKREADKFAKEQMKLPKEVIDAQN